MLKSLTTKMSISIMTVRQQNRLRRNERIRQTFQQRYTDAARPRKFSREYVLAQLADDYCLAVATIEDIIYTKTTIQVEAIIPEVVQLKGTATKSN
jgi:hypothetical protein